ncbi:MAG: hypothetical protein IJO61_08110 [Oscillospiraceae bacterium]|nr:hypothetical protein [Oscillospiraceae bacterium]
MKKLLAGWSEVSITPENKRISLAGQFFERISEYVETPITVTALAIESDGEQMIICSCDVASVSQALVDEVREKLSGVAGLDVNKIIINATHSHTSHVYSRGTTSAIGTTKDVIDRYLPEEKQYRALVSATDKDIMRPNEAADFLVERISLAIKNAWEGRKEGSYATGFGRAAIGMCRRVCYDDGSAKMWGDTNRASFTHLEGGNDSGIELLFFFDDSKKLTGVVANVACPSQVVEHRSFISSDYWGKVRILLREKFGEDLKVLGLCSPAGDQCPRDMIRWVNPETPIDDPNIERPDYIERDADPSMFDIKGTWKVGKRIVNEILSAYDEIENTYDEALLVHKTLKVDLPIRRVTPAEYEVSVKALEDFAVKLTGHANFADNAAMYIHAGTILRYEQQHTEDIKTIEVHIARLGDIAFATNPFELFLDYGNQMRARSRARQTFLIQLACDACGYLPTKKAEDGGHYSAYVTSGITGHVGGEILTRKTISEINEMFK